LLIGGAGRAQADSVSKLILSERIRACFPAGYEILKCRDYSGEYRLEQNISREKGCGEDVAAKCLQFIEVL